MVSRIKNTAESYDKVIVNTLKSVNVPVPLNLLSFLTGIEKSRLCKCLKSLQKFGLVSKATVTDISLYKLNKVNKSG